MSAKLNNGSITFGDGSSLSSANIPWDSVAGIPTALSQFTNNLGNYGGFLSPASISSTPGVGPQGGGGSGAEGPVQFQLTWDGTLIGLHSPNCNCVCNC